MRVVSKLADVVLISATFSLSYGLPWPISSSYNSRDVQASVDFMVDNLGAVEIDPNVTVATGCDASMRWVSMPGSGYEFHFISTPSLATPNFSFTDFVNYTEGLYGNLSQVSATTYDQFMDYHVGMITDDMTTFYTALKTHNTPFFMVGQYPSFFDLFVEIPGTGIILELTSQRLDIPDVPISNWDICQDAVAPRQDLPVHPKEAAVDNSVFPTLNWRKTTFAAPYPAYGEAFSISFFGAVHIEQGHPGVWANKCAKIAWSEFEYVGPAGNGYQFHFVDGVSYPPYPPAMGIVDFAKWQVASRNFVDDKWDEWANHRLTMWTDDLAPYLDMLLSGSTFVNASLVDSAPPAPFVPEFVVRVGGGLYSVVVDTTPIAGQVVELVSSVYPTGDAYPAPTSWDFC
mmetsp:Transcript_1654/g.3502  ORF Transcript_1654/g.3502 Transcript_1654/m.3502 type:complete len:401 (-) Transcript_1654:246-1448(-)